ncbi:acyl-ACP--UDP-N-acetylglucosamine O-acyltransferase [Chlamydiifrater phoenicopteri]|uniref:acyl-ACP--UDP-N-acetylglucosamine O-acyltransferase n=1 Tax=Chlamydiifrater phoenicopteri TaxID=2681469 RepID=UPI001BD0A3C8|nr:acyl-ACP--UDP-N-acetylglucosamine O-acyltransferase [Chlamydiifrater phoenicopteri]
MTNIHPTAIVEPGAQIGEDVVIEPFAVIKATVVLEDRVVVKAHAYIDGYTTIGEGTTVWPSAMIGNKPQDLKYRGEKTFVVIGKNCEIREFAIITSSTFEGTKVSIGDNCLLMPGVHIAHNCSIGNHVIISNYTQLAGHVQVGDYAVIGGMVGVHQFVRIGAYSMIGGLSGVRRDVPPYTIGMGDPLVLGGINKVGLQRRKLPFSVRSALIRAFKIVYSSDYSFKDALDIAEQELGVIPEVAHFLEFCREDSKRGIERNTKKVFFMEQNTEREEVLVES